MTREEFVSATSYRDPKTKHWHKRFYTIRAEVQFEESVDQEEAERRFRKGLNAMGVTGLRGGLK